MSTFHLNAKDVPAYLRNGYTGTKFQVQTAEVGCIPSDAGLSSGGSRDTYQLVELATGKAAQVSLNTAPWDSSRSGDNTFQMRQGFALVRHSMFCGHDHGLTFILHPDDAVKMLPAATEPLSRNEQLVLDATRSFKASYNGQDRYQMAQDRSRWSTSETSFPSRAEWQEAKDSLIERKFLNKAGAITPDGRNASQSLN